MSDKCIIHGCVNHKDQGTFVENLCTPCYEFITTKTANNSQANKNQKQLKQLEDEIQDMGWISFKEWNEENGRITSKEYEEKWFHYWECWQSAWEAAKYT